MNTNTLKKFAQAARRKLLTQVGSKLEQVLHTDSVELREKAEQIKNLQEEINKTGKQQVIDKVAYTWFNRLMALRFMDANDYQPLGIRVVTPKNGFTLPELLDEAKQGHISDELPVKKQHVFDLLDGRIPSTNSQNEAYKELLIGACNHLNKVFPFLFERINDYTELLLPDDITSEFSVVQDVRDGMTIEDCAEVEIIGWLYQFYISELNEELISSKNTYKRNELAPASQLFTPKWIVQYMVDNTLGQLWSEIQPKTNLTSTLEFYIKPAYLDQLENRKSKSIEEIKFFDPCVGSAHILSYAFDVYYKIYEELGYNPTEIPELIITKNLFGVDIDQRAAQLGSFVLLMKGRQKHKRFLRSVEKNNIQPNISFFQDFEFDPKFKNASVLGSLIKVEPHEISKIKIDESSLYSEKQRELNKLYHLLGERYDLVVTNPPYISSSRMEGSLKQYVETNYPDTKSDLFATFVLRNLELCNKDGLTGYMTPFVWMFISSYEKLRETIIDNHFINNLIQLEYSGFDGATVPICTFTLRNKRFDNAKGSYIRLSDFKGSQNQAPKTLEAIQNPKCGWFYTANQKAFSKISGIPIGYWLSNRIIKFFEHDKFEDIGLARQGLATGNNNKFIRQWFEIQDKSFLSDICDYYSALNSNAKWFPYNKGGAIRRWYGNQEFVLAFNKENFNLLKESGNHLPSRQLYCKQSISWSDVTSGANSFRYYPQGFFFDVTGMSYFNDDNLLNVLGILNSKLFSLFSKLINPTLHFQIGDFRKLPYCSIESPTYDNIVRECINISKSEWDSFETSWDFKKNELIRINVQKLEETFNSFQQTWKSKFFQLHKNEEELNRQFIEIYGLQDELTPDVPLEDITILKEETSIENGELVFHADEVFAQFVSYAVGCMFGRYSLDKEGLILANQGETLEDYLQKVFGSSSPLEKRGIKGGFLPDEDNIIPVLDDEWFEDDITARFYEFLKASFGKENFEKNLAFVEECLGKDIRKYFVKDFYTDHNKRYKKRPIYWMFSSPKGSFNVLIYMHRYTPDTLNRILNGYLKEFRAKLNSRVEHLDHLINTGSSTEQIKANKEKDKIRVIQLELLEYERDILYPLATERISIDLDDGVLVNYNKFGKAIKEVKDLNDKTTKEKVRKFDWINTEEIR